MTAVSEGEPWEYWRNRAIAAEITMSQMQQSDAADEVQQAHDDLDTLHVPRHENGLPLSVPGRILRLARMLQNHKLLR